MWYFSYVSRGLVNDFGENDFKDDKVSILVNNWIRRLCLYTNIFLNLFLYYDDCDSDNL